VIRDAVMLGFAAVQPIVTARARVVDWRRSRAARGRAMARIRGVVGQAVRPRRGPVVAPADRLRRPPSLAHSVAAVHARRAGASGTDAVGGCTAALRRPPRSSSARRRVDARGTAALRRPRPSVGIGTLTLRATPPAMVAARLLTHVEAAVARAGSA
jgi:hypothetical protein